MYPNKTPEGHATLYSTIATLMDDASLSKQTYLVKDPAITFNDAASLSIRFPEPGLVLRNSR